MTGKMGEQVFRLNLSLVRFDEFRTTTHNFHNFSRGRKFVSIAMKNANETALKGKEKGSLNGERDCVEENFDEKCGRKS